MSAAYVSWNAGVCRVLAYPSQKLITQGVSFERTTRRARRRGFSVRVYSGWGSYVLKPMKGSA